MKYLIISAVGDDSLHSEWIAGNPEFDLCLIYYGNNETIATSYSKQSTFFHHAQGMKYRLIHEWVKNNFDLVQTYTYIWLPDNDVSIATDHINKLFKTAEEYNLMLSQPAMTGYISHRVTQPQPGSFLRYTNFVEVLAPLMHINTLLKLTDTFLINYSGWGYDYLWPLILGYPENKIAIIDAIIMCHTKPIGTDYSRFPKHPKKEMKEIIKQHKKDIQKKIVVYACIPIA
ncbi:MAG: hypothetical protein IM598_06745 [Chitinophagaceae bacterium]|nr:hypothetical protein [Chitinophagaceae bacterium]MCA6459640.1 hypothetical protein [Chitinophagaceae bacterium]MCA6464507.1 hypothetical protein [Chitinophagaceae bacterium]